MKLHPCERCNESEQLFFIGWTYTDAKGPWLKEHEKWIPVIKCESCYLEWKEIGMTDEEISQIKDGRQHFNTNKLGHHIHHEIGGVQQN